MKSITLIATDLDGTFLNSKKKVTSLNKEAVSKLKQYGILFGLLLVVLLKQCVLC